MNKNTSISVIMTVYNSSKTLERSINSILNQTFKDFELIIVDDCSTDDSRKIIEKYKNKDKRIVTHYNNINLKNPKSLNAGLNLSKGKYIAIQDSDDFSLKNRLEVEYNYLEKNKGVYLVGASIHKLDNEGNKIYTTKRINWPSFIIKLNLIFIKVVLNHSSVMYRNTKEVFYNNEKFLASDYSFYLDLLEKNKKIKNIRNILGEYTYTGSSITITKNFEQKIEAIASRNAFLLRYYFKKDPSKIIDNEYIENLRKKNYKIKYSLEIKNLYRLGNIEEGNKKLFIYIKNFKRIPLMYFLAFLISKFNKKILRMV